MTQNPDNPVKKEILAEAIVEISKGVKALLKSGLNRRAVVILLQDAMPKKSGGGTVSKKTIDDVLDCLANLEKRYCR